MNDEVNSNLTKPDRDNLPRQFLSEFAGCYRKLPIIIRTLHRTILNLHRKNFLIDSNLILSNWQLKRVPNNANRCYTFKLSGI